MSHSGFECLDCGHRQPRMDPPVCEACGGPLDPVYEYDATTAAEIRAAAGDSMWDYAPVLPGTADTAVSMGEGRTPLVSAESLADELGIDRVLIKDDGQTPTGTTHDRAFAASITGLNDHQHGETALGVASTGPGGQSAAAYAGRGGFPAHVFIPARASFGSQAMINVHAADMNVVEGRYPETKATYETAREDNWVQLDPFVMPFRHDGLKTAAYEVFDALDWTAPDLIVTPAGHGELPVAFAKAARELRALDLIETTPRIVLVQPQECAPLVEAIDTDADSPTPWEHPDTICGSLEITDPAGGSYAIDAVNRTDGTAVSVPDAAILNSACETATTAGLELGTGGGAAVAGLKELASRNRLDAAETVVLFNPNAAMQQVDVIRSHLMSTEWDRKA